jgi:hypothetical protein
MSTTLDSRHGMQIEGEVLGRIYVPGRVSVATVLGSGLLSWRVGPEPLTEESRHVIS